MPLQEERTGWGVWFFLFLFHTPIYINEDRDSITKTVCRKKQHIYIVMFFKMKILICCKPAVIDKFNLLADNRILKKNGIEYRTVSLGNPYYYNDGFTVQGITIRFDYELAKDMQELYKKEEAFLKSMKRKRKHCIGYYGRCGIYILVYGIINVQP